MQVYIKSKQAKSLYIIYSILSVAILSLILINFAYAESVDYSVVVEPVLNITTSGDTEGVVSLDLNPETKAFDSKNLTVTVGTNNETGYKLYVNTTGDTTNLVEKNDSNLYIQTLADNGTTGYTENTFTANRWGYKLNTQNYFPFVSGALVNSSDIATAGVSSTLTFGAKASYDTKAGSYALALNFQATANPLCDVTINGTMQDFDPCPDMADGTTGSLTDSRDGQIYTIAKINGNFWMTRNLAIGCNGSGSTYGSSMSSKTLNSTNSNVDSTWSTPTASLDKSDNTTGCTTSSTSGCDSHTVARMKCSSSYGAWYNYAAASAGTITGSSNSNPQIYDVCPTGWRLPSYIEGQSIISYKNDFNPVYNHAYTHGEIYSGQIGTWWYSTTLASDPNRRANLYYRDNVLLAQDPGSGAGHRYNGYGIRCIRSS